MFIIFRVIISSHLPHFTRTVSELDELLQDLDEDVEGMQGTIYYLQQELKKSKEKVAALEAKNQELCAWSCTNGNQNIKSETNLVSGEKSSCGDEHGEAVPAPDESSNDSYLILEANPENEEYATMLSIDEELNKNNDNEDAVSKSKRVIDDSSKNVPLKKQKRNPIQTDGEQDAENN